MPSSHSIVSAPGPGAGFRAVLVDAWRARPWLPALLACAAYAAFFYRDLLFEGRIYVFRDNFTFVVAMDHAVRELARWHWPPLWNPLQSMGKPLAADLQNALYYPASWLAHALPEPLGFNFSVVLHHVLGAAGMYALLRYARASVLAAAFGGLLFGFGGLAVACDNMINALRSVVWVPWTILAFEHWCDRRHFAALVGVALTLGATVLGAQPEVAVFENVLLCARACDRARPGAGPSLCASALAIVSANLLVLGLCAVQLLPFAELVRNSSRTGAGATDASVAYSLAPWGGLAFLVPRRFVDAAGNFHGTAALWEGALDRAPWAVTLYLGPGLVFLVRAGSLASRFQRRWWTGVTLVFLALALGKHLPGYVWGIEHLPMLRSIRYPEKFLVVVHALLAFAAALGLESCLRRPEAFRAAAVAAAALAVPALLAGVVFARSDDFARGLLGRDLRVLALLLVAVALLAAAARRFPRGAAVALLALVAADLYRVNGRLLPTVSWREATRPPRALSAMPRAGDPLRIYSVPPRQPLRRTFPDEGLREKNLLLMEVASYHLVGNLNAPASVNLADHEKLNRLIESAPKERKARILAALNTAYVTSESELRTPGLSLVQRPLRPLGAWVYRVDGVVPRAFVPRRVRPVHGAQEAMEHLAGAADPLDEATVSELPVPAGLPAATQGTVTIASYRPDRVELVAEMATAGLVVLNDSFYPGWQVRVDGRPREIVRANYFARGVFVAAGQHRIVFEYRPLSHRLGSLVSVLTAAAVLLGLVSRRRGAAAMPVPAAR